MKCPKCKAPLSPAPRIWDTCLYCDAEITLSRCHHEPANFSNVDGANVMYSLWAQPLLEITLPYHVCRLCGVFYTDLEAVEAGEKKYQEAQEAE